MRNIDRNLQEYDRLTRRKLRDPFSASDLKQLADLSDDKYDLISNALKLGYAVGHAAGEREAKAKRATA